MPVGSELNEDLPVPGVDTPSEFAEKTADTLELLVDAVEDLVPSSAIDVVADLDLNDHGLEGAGFVELESQVSLPLVDTGRLVKYQADLYWIHADGACQITNNDGLAAAPGGITGDFGDGDESFEYDAVNHWFTAFDGPSDYAGFRGDKLVLRNTSNGAQASLVYGGTGNHTLTFPSAPGGARLMQVDGSGNVTYSNTLAGTFIATAVQQSVYSTFYLDPSSYQSASTNTFDGPDKWDLGNTVDPVVIPIMTRAGGTIDAFQVGANKLSDAGNTLSAVLQRYNILTGAITSISTATNAENAPGVIVLASSGIAHTTLAGYSYRIVVSQTDATPSAVDSVYGTAIAFNP